MREKKQKRAASGARRRAYAAPRLQKKTRLADVTQGFAQSAYV